MSIVTPPAFRGRVMAADYVVGAGGPQLGSVEAGAVGSLTTPVISALSGGLLVVAGTAAIALALPAFRRYRLDAAGRRGGRRPGVGRGPMIGVRGRSSGRR